MQRELQRVIPQLKVTIRSTNRDWRMHSEQVQRLERQLMGEFREARPVLEQQLEEASRAMERIASREQHLNEQFQPLLHTHRLRRNELAELQERYRESSGTLTARTDSLNAINREMELLKGQLEEQATQHLNGGAPILRVKQAIARLETQIFTMRVQIAATEQALLQSQLADRVNMSGQ